jgi:hypothetical protein
MGSKDAAFENDLLLHIFQNSAIANIGDGTGLPAGTEGSLFIGLHTADPDGGTQSTSEATYTGYARKAVARSSGGWTVAASACENAAAVTFAPCTGGSNTITYFSVGAETSGATLILYSGILDAQLIVSDGITPEFAAGALDVTEA